MLGLLQGCCMLPCTVSLPRTCFRLGLCSYHGELAACTALASTSSKLGLCSKLGTELRAVQPPNPCSAPGL